MTQKPRTLHESLPAYVNGTLSGDEKRSLDQWLAKSPAARRELAAWKKMRSAIAGQAVEEVPAQVEQRLLQSIQLVRQSGRRPSRAAVISGYLAIAIAVLVFGYLLASPGMVLHWSISDPGASVASYRIYRSSAGSELFRMVGEIPAQQGVVDYKFVDPLLAPGKAYIYLIEGVDEAGAYTVSQAVDGDVSTMWISLLSLLAAAILGAGVLYGLQKSGTRSFLNI